MSASEQDLEQLESYLDNALSQREADTLRLRMCQEPSFGAVLEQLRVERAQRSRVFQSLEGSDRASELVMCRMQSSIRRLELQTRHRRYMRLVGSAAACFVVGFGVAIFAGGRMPGHTGEVVTNPNNQTIENTRTVSDENPFMVGNNNSWSGSPTGINESGYGPYQVIVRDSSQNPVMIRRFASFEEATQFTELLRQQKNATPANGLPAGERF